ncbi:Pr6Pr family membrane protein [Pseudomonas fluorescens]|uniref:Pr6Pr family membrane protein n=1 Tax=Pseudomonas TaxID=286 RepID=UPI00177AEBB6|nr:MULTISPECIES: Pr6Pr family membrane protein [Pseudomonas]MBD8192236.1 Pr6Pr family membrane protein [Pseudomonas fluorescens]MBD8226860.1 Pr6Pr family membrane protein [Pseudomonas fluorescens]MBD8784573.1 Pr6Pr family membrane protein [Pseudomonas fluorescens]MBD8817253.1 Pr6Pr family membrane protein [Pseudomonas fluorescens]MCM2363051.1 Pr6Pr family membrane protein [Pseudomonas sp. SR18]
MKRFIAAAALAGWMGLATQQYLIFYSRWEAGASLLGGLINFFSFFTVLTNTLAVVVLSYALVQRDSAAKRFFLRPAISSGIAVSILVVGLAYSLLLRHLWQPEGFQFIADELLHDVMPVLFFIYWWRCVPKGTLRFKHIGAWVLYPLVYFAYALLRGDLLGQYQYPFIDVGTLGYPQVFVNAGGILAGFVAIALAVVGLDKVIKPPT